jgi:ubiquinone/menaquinone biosynthesis C-methylase UbiE
MSGGESFDPYADQYDATVQSAISASGESVAFFAQLKARLARARAPKQVRSVLDFGCGIGNVSRALAAEFPESGIVGTDPSSESLVTARERSPGLRFELSTTVLPFEDGTFDMAVAACVFHHIPPAERAHWMRELARVLRPGGRLIVFEHNPHNPLTRQVVRNVPFDEGVVLLRRRETRALVRESGLREHDAAYYFFFPRLLAGLRVLEPLMGWVPVGAQYLVTGER